MARHILVMDDQADVRDVILGMLDERGFMVTAAPRGSAMRDILAAQGTPIDAVVLDALMPGEPSANLALHAKALQIPVVMISGSPDSMKFAEDNGVQLLRKPFHVDELVLAIEKAIASGQFWQRDA
jgi:two-component system, OmpR family, response regulator